MFVTFPAISTRAATVGARWNVAGLPLDVSYVHAFEQETTGVSSGHLLGSEYVGSHTTMNQNVFTIGTVIQF